jgi:predicted GNAT family acetyltransferase
MIHFSCRPKNFIPTAGGGVRWLDQDADFVLAQAYWRELGQTLTRKTWETAHQFGYTYAGLLAGSRIVSCAAVWRYSPQCWEVAAVSTLPDFRRQGYAKRVVSFITEYILSSGKLATCGTDDDNLAMIATALSVGFQVVPEELVWWNFPDMPDF